MPKFEKDNSVGTTSVEATYEIFMQNINDTKQNFPEFYKRFESRLSCRAALAGALAMLDKEHLHGGLGAKAYAKIEQSNRTR